MEKTGRTEAVALDVGGTFVKYGVVRAGVIGETGQFPIRENGTAEEILGPILAFLTAHPAPRVAVSIPGPMDYPRGMSLMKHKFAAIYGVSLADWLGERLPGTDIVFVHDGVAFALGEMLDGALAGCGCAAGVMLGTGLGFALCRSGRVSVGPALTPAHPLWNAPYGEGIAEEAVSGRAMRRRWLAMGREALDVREIAQLAKEGDAQASALFEQTGEDLGRMLSAHLAAWPVERIAVGGQIARSWALMAPGYARACAIPALPAAHIGDAALRGALAYARQGDALLEMIS